MDEATARFKDTAWERLRGIEDRLLEFLAGQSNQVHGVAWAPEQWNVVHGAWIRGVLRSSVGLQVHQRWEDALDRPRLGIPIDTWQLRDLTFTRSWERACLSLFRTDHVHQLEVARELLFDADHESPADLTTYDSQLGIHHGSALKRVGRKFAGLATPWLPPRYTAVFSASYMRRSQELRAALSRGRIPVRLEDVVPPSQRVVRSHNRVDVDARQRILESAHAVFSDPSDRAIALLAALTIPRIFLEDFRSAFEQTKRWPLPDSPRFIITANSFGYFDLFKIWLASQKGPSVHYIALQHGGQYGCHRWHGPSHEELTSDLFVTWGWNSPRGNYFPGACQKHLARSRVSRSGSSHLNRRQIVVQMPEAFSGFDHFQSREERHRVDDNLVDLVHRLPPETRRDLLVRLRSGSQIGLDCDIDSQLAQYGVRVDAGETPIVEIWRSAQLVVHYNDSTGFLETMSLDVPTMGMWGSPDAHLLDWVKPMYLALERVGVIHEDPASLADFITANRFNLDEWWSLPEVRQAVQELRFRLINTAHSDGARLAEAMRNLEGKSREAEDEL